MPPPANQSSKAALVTWTVIATVFGITMAVIAIVLYAGQNDALRRLDSLRDQYNDVASEADLTGTRVAELKTASQGGNVLNYVLVRHEDFADSVAGSRDVAAAAEQVNNTLAAVNARADDGLSAPNLTAAVGQTLGKIDQLKNERDALSGQLTDLRQDLTRTQETSQQQIAAKDEQVRAAQQAQQEAVARAQQVDEQLAQVQQSTGQTIDELTLGFGKSIEQVQNTAEQAIAERDEVLQNFQKLTAQRRSRFGGDQMVASADGSVLVSPNAGQLTINLGKNDGITTGLTFQVYDATRGIPKGESETDLPRGKASIEVTSVSPTFSTARVISTQPGETIRQGDLIANLAYDKNVPVRFRIYGDFDLDNDTVSEPRDRERIETLVREFGGRVVSDVTVETDVLVLGKEPVVPTLTPEEQQDALKVAEQQRLRDKLAAYQDVLDNAQRLGVKVFNQSAFLYEIGYFEQVRR